MKQTEIKTKKLSQVVFNDGYVVINGNYLIKAHLVQLDDTLLQSKIDNNEPFVYNYSTKSFGDNIPPVKQLIPAYDSDKFDILQTTDLYTRIIKDEAEVFYNANKRYFAYINSNYLNTFRKCDVPFVLRQSSNLSAVAVFDNTELDECLFLVMPVQRRMSFLEIFEGVEV